MRWWDLDQVVVIEQASFAADAWSIETFWSELAETDTRRYTVAETPDGRIAGYVGVAVIQDEADVQTIAVDPDRRGQGLGRRLLAVALDEARAAGARRIHLEVRSDNEAALGLYDADGFERTGRRHAYYAASAGPVDAVLMTRVLDRRPS